MTRPGRAFETKPVRRQRRLATREIRQFFENSGSVLGRVGASTGRFGYRGGGRFQVITEVALTRAKPGLGAGNRRWWRLSAELVGTDGRLSGRR